MKRSTFLFAAVLCAGLLLTGCHKTNCRATASAAASAASSSQAVASSCPDVSSQPDISLQIDPDVSQPDDVSNQGGLVNTIRTDNDDFNKKFQKNPIDAAYIESMNNALSTVDMEETANKYAKLWEKEIIHAYASLKTSLASDPAKWSTVETEQKTWEKGKDAALKKITDEAMAGGGTVARVQASSDVMEYYRKRAAALYLRLYEVDPNYTYAYTAG
jgi:uncharacterized protein YecT (DUF1311 family)